MHKMGKKPRALFLLPEGIFLRDDLICSGIFPSHLDGKPCPFADGGKMPKPQPLDEAKVSMHPKLGRVGDVAPPCVVEQLGPLREWRRREGVRYPSDLSPLRLYKCRQMFLLVVPGLAQGHHIQKESSPN
ncbi:MAG: hypothetical protein AMJ88_16605 [Anaerolineae bacterium SM23_ 63]|nr:MAG: hypothetical protein AMJ88_16605 [Anaerolineae bacterium SM23_ 63]